MITRNLEKAKMAFLKKDAEASRAAHMNSSPEEHMHQKGQYIKSIVYGGLDGIITTFAVVAGVAGASLSPAIVLILGFANLVADGISMAVGDYLSTKAEKEYEQAERKREQWEVEHYPEGEVKEMVELYMEKGFSKNDAELVTSVFSKNKKAWVDIMMVEELGIVETDESPLKNALATFLSFAFFGFVPLIAYIISKFIPWIRVQTFFTAAVLTAMTLFVMGAVKVKVTGQKWFKSGIEMLIVGGVAAAAAYAIGAALSRIV
jgi:VIT1/CCC1 family predicted Fe2+/Mn2+ transporter